ncbi:MAG: cell division protein FtsQ/DivIB [Acidiferrobacterales bacterium]|nr:cell division protein FtsQ/DivIB [Acidiferrobacterales bacterium]
MNRNQRYQNFVQLVRKNSAAGSESSRGGGVIVVSILAVVMSAGAIFGLGVDYLLHPQRFPLKHINVEGKLVNTHPSQIQNAIAQVISSSNILQVDVSKTVAAAQALPWVENASISRRWPDTLDVRVSERVISARWNSDRWLDQTGVAVTLLNHADESLPVLRGENGSGKEVLNAYRKFEKIFRNYGLEVTELSRSARGSWDVELQAAESEPAPAGDLVAGANRIKVILGQIDPAARVERFGRLYSELLHDVAEQISVVDMRYPDGVAVRWIDEEPRLDGVIKLKNS